MIEKSSLNMRKTRKIEELPRHRKGHAYAFKREQESSFDCKHTHSSHGIEAFLIALHLDAHPMLSPLMLAFSILASASTLNLPLPSLLNTTANLTQTDRCSHSPDWQAYAFLVEDCYAAISRLYVEDVLQHPDELFEFHTAGSRRRTSHPEVRTPSQLTVGNNASLPTNL